MSPSSKELDFLPRASDSDALPGPEGLPEEPAPRRRPIRMLISACLLGEQVRYDGGHKYAPYLVRTLGEFVTWERVCPEADAGMGIPRPSMHLVGDPKQPRLINRKGADLTDQMVHFTQRWLEALEVDDLCGYICKKGSPSSGMERVKVYDANGMPSAAGTGLFTGAFMRRHPLIPVEEEGRLHDARLRESFIERVFCRYRWLDLVRGGKEIGRLVAFHTDHKLHLLSHGQKALVQLGQLVADAKRYDTEELFAVYERQFTQAVAKPAGTGNRANVLQHMAGFFREHLTKDEKAELQETIDAFRDELVPLVVPLTLVKHYVRKYGVSYLARQTFLQPYPAQFMLRNDV